MSNDIYILLAAVIISFVAGMVMMAYVNSHIVRDTKNFDNLKADCYTSGFIDGRASMLEEMSPSGYIYKPSGVPKGYISDRTSDWRLYADNLVSSQQRKIK